MSNLPASQPVRIPVLENQELRMNFVVNATETHYEILGPGRPCKKETFAEALYEYQSRGASVSVPELKVTASRVHTIGLAITQQAAAISRVTQKLKNPANPGEEESDG